MKGNTISCKPNSKLHAKSLTRYKSYTAKSNVAYLDWYFCDPVSESYPIRNVSKLSKLEPHYEDLTFNACRSCNQGILNSALNKGVRYIFFFTKYVGNKNKIDRTYFITGFYEINKEKYVKDKKREKRKAVKAKINAKFLDIHNAIKLQSIGINIYNARHAPKYLSEKQVKSILKKFKKSKNVIRQYRKETPKY